MTLMPQGKEDRSWGYEITWSSNEEYSGKILVFNKQGAKTPMMIHKNRKKSWFINAGNFKIIFIDIKTGQQREVLIQEGKTVDIGEMSPHSVELISQSGVIFEAGSPDHIDDQFLLSPDALQTQPSEPGLDPQSSHHHDKA